MEFIDHSLIQEMVDRIVTQFDPQKIIFFGSYAQGNPTPDSDVDLLVIMDDKRNRLELLRAIRRAVRDIPAPKDILIRTPDEVEKFGKYIGTILFPALRDGEVMYERK